MEIATRGRSMREILLAIVRHPGRSTAVVLALGAAALGTWWATQLWGLPDIGDPFDVAAFEAENVPDDERNAFYYYRDAAGMTRSIGRKFQASQNTKDLNTFPANWAEAKPAWREFLAGSGEALALWRLGAEKQEARYDHPEGISMRTLLPVTQELRMLARLAVLEGFRRESEGDMAGAWEWYRATLRSSRHSGKHGFQVERLVGAAMHGVASKALDRWADDPRVDAPLLRRALDEVIAIDAMTAPRSETLKLEYLLFTRSMGDPNMIEDVLVSKNYPDEPNDWCQDLPVSDATKKPIQAARLILGDDYQRSLRVFRLMTANWLAQVDKPPSRRSRLARTGPPIYEADPSAPAGSRALSPEKLGQWLDSSMLASRVYRDLSRHVPSIDNERSRQAALVVHLADQLYRREHGQAPPSPRALVGPYLKSLPEGYDVPIGNDL